MRLKAREYLTLSIAVINNLTNCTYKILRPPKKVRIEMTFKNRLAIISLLIFQEFLKNTTLEEFKIRISTLKIILKSYKIVHWIWRKYIFVCLDNWRKLIFVWLDKFEMSYYYSYDPWNGRRKDTIEDTM